MFRRSGRFLAALLLAVSLVLGVGAVAPAGVGAHGSEPHFCFNTDWFRWNGFYYQQQVVGRDAGGRNIMRERSGYTPASATLIEYYTCSPW